MEATSGWKSFRGGLRPRWTGTFVALAGALALLASHRLEESGELSLPEPVLTDSRGAEPVRVSPMELLARAASADSLLRRVVDVYYDEVAPLERVLAIYRNDPNLVRRIAIALHRESRRAGVDPWLLLAVLLVENAPLDSAARSPAGAIGLMQVMPSHLGQWPACEPDLDAVEANICHGARIFAEYLRQERGDVDRALLRYNGCVQGTNTPECHRYPNDVFARAGRATVHDWLSSVTQRQGD